MEDIFSQSPSLGVTSFLIGITLTLAFLYLKNYHGKSKNSLPPGPFRFPLVGSASILPKVLSNVERHQLRIDLPKEYGNILSFGLGKINIVWLNDLESIKEAFITKGDIISDRTSSKISSPLAVGGVFEKYSGLGIGEANHSKAFKERKKLALQSMKEFGFGGVPLEDKVIEETENLINALKKFANSPSNGKIKTIESTDIHQQLIHLAVSNVICSVVFGQRFEYDDASFVSAVDGIKWLFSKQRGKQIADSIPFAKYVPAVQRLIAKENEQASNVLSFIEKQVQSHQESFDASVDPKDFIDICLQKAELDANRNEEKASEHDNSEVGTENVKKIIADLFFAGTDTTATSLMWFLLYMMRYPEIQRRCHSEIDAQFGDARGRGFTKDAITRLLPYTTASMLESQRISSIANASIPHVVREDTTIGGYSVPKHSLVLANIRFLHFDDRYWKNPELFDPTRWLEAVPSDGINTSGFKVVQHSHFIPFSVGKRKCLGENLAKAEYLIFGLSLLKSFKFQVEDLLDPPSLVGQGLILSPQPFRMVIEQRE